MTATLAGDVDYVCVIDVSQHQGVIDFAAMRAAGVDKIILRTNHSLIVDARCRTYYRDALTSGFRLEDIGFYTFCNPKRASARDAAQAFVDTVEWIGAPEDALLMLDVESYREESPDVGTIWPAAQYAPWLAEHLSHVQMLAPRARVIGYSNASFWNAWVGDRKLAARMEWIVPRYPVYSAAGYALHPVPTPASWAPWAFARGPTGPIPPAGVKWDGWQFSAGYNGQGHRYGVASGDLDLNIVTVEAWRRWTSSPVTPPAPQPGVDIDATEEETVRIKVQPENVWFERIGMDLHTVSSGNLFLKMPGAKVDESDIAVLSATEMAWEISATRYTYGELTPAQAERMGADFVTLWNTNHDPGPIVAVPGPTPAPVPRSGRWTTD